MDPVTSVIIAGAATGLGKTATTAVVDSYKALKGLLTGKFGQESDLLDSVRSLEKKPDSTARQGVVELTRSATVTRIQRIMAVNCTATIRHLLH